ncbi:MAG: glutamate---cysteine ligase / carboxylate-amine ligase [Solirubrobacteraceae bacterium]|nr:glutamate---cysteine ligase / carboxylate-amine ligase [Solirubrobacteraceae bacterium]
MILDGDTLDLAPGIGDLVRDDDGNAVKPELHQSVLEIATEPAATVADAGAQLRRLREMVRERAADRGLRVAAAGTHPFGSWEDQLISPSERYRTLIDELGFVARQEVIFGLHVHVAVDDPDTAIRVANGMRNHTPLLLALSANSPYWEGTETGMASARTPIFAQFPRVGLPPRYADWEDWLRRMEFMIRAGMVEDHTWFWWDVRVSPGFGTVETRVMDCQTRVEHTLGLAALVQALVRELAEGGPAPVVPDELLAENRWQAARYGVEGELVDLPSSHRVPVAQLARRALDRAREHADDLGAGDALEALDDLLEKGNGAMHQRKVYAANQDFRELVRDLADAT